MSLIIKVKKIPFIFKNEGLGGIFRRVENHLLGHPYLRQFQQSYQQWFNIHFPTDQILAEQKLLQAQFARRPLVSIITPTYNTNPNFLKSCIESVLSQTYDNWELCIVDDASSNLETLSVLENYAKHPKIHISYRKKNGHIAKASNDALHASKGEWVCILDHDDYLWPNALYEVVKLINQKPKALFIYSDEDKLSEDGNRHEEPFFKPDWSPHFMWACNYITHFATINKMLLLEIGGFESKTDGAQDWDVFLRIAQHLHAYDQHPISQECQIQHISTILYSWRKSPTSTSSAKYTTSAKSYAHVAQQKAIQSAISNHGGGEVRESKYPGVWIAHPHVSSSPLISIIIPTKNNVAYLKKCVSSILEKSSYTKYELIIADTGSTESSTTQYYADLKNRTNTSIYFWDKSFNYSAVMNWAAQKARGAYYVFLNDDTEVITNDWLEQLLSYAQLPEVGAVGCKLFYPNGTIQHAGLVLTSINVKIAGMAPFVANQFRLSRPADVHAVMALLHDTTRDVSAVTAACMMIDAKKHKFIGGYDEQLAIAFNDVDYCLKLQQKKYFNILNPHVQLTHHESVTVGQLGENKRKMDDFAAEMRRMYDSWGEELRHDCFFNANLELIDGLPYVISSRH